MRAIITFSDDTADYESDAFKKGVEKVMADMDPNSFWVDFETGGIKGAMIYVQPPTVQTVV